MASEDYNGQQAGWYPLRTPPAWTPIEEMGPMKPQRLLLCGVFEGHKWIEICLWVDGGWCTSNGQGVLGIRYFQKLPPFPEEMK